MKLKHLIQAARLRTLPLSVSGIIVGCSLANFTSAHILGDTISIFCLALLTTISFQVLSNFANDYGDGIKGTDANRTGEKRLVASGDISAKAMKTVMISTAIIALILSILTLLAAFGTSHGLAFSVFLMLGIASIIAAIKYTVGSNAYGYSGFGDLFVFLFFGYVSTVGSYYLYTNIISWQLFLPATSIGLLSVAVLNLNNLRDRENDAKAKKNTLVVKIGLKKAKWYHLLLVFVALFCAISYSCIMYTSPLQFIYLVAFLPILYNVKLVYSNKNPSDLDKELKKVALSTFAFAILFSIFN